MIFTRVKQVVHKLVPKYIYSYGPTQQLATYQQTKPMIKQCKFYCTCTVPCSGNVHTLSIGTVSWGTLPQGQHCWAIKFIDNLLACLVTYSLTYLPTQISCSPPPPQCLSQNGPSIYQAAIFVVLNHCFLYFLIIKMRDVSLVYIYYM